MKFLIDFSWKIIFYFRILLGTHDSCDIQNQMNAYYSLEKESKLPIVFSFSK